MSSSYHQACVALDPDGIEKFPNGIRRQAIELVLRDDPERPFWRALEPAVCGLDATRARELAFERLMLAELAEHWERTR